MKSSKLCPSTEGGPDHQKTIALEQIRTHPTFVDLLPVAEDLLENMIRDMRGNGYYQSEPIVLGTWQGQEAPVLIDGHMRIRAASKAGITRAPFVLEEFDDEMAALHHAVNLQTKRRTTTDGALYRLCEQYDRLMKSGGDRRSGEARSKMQPCILDRGSTLSARRTARLIGCHYRKVDKIRKVRRDGTPEIRDAVRNDQCSINKAYDLIRKMELGENEQKSRRKLSAAQIKVVKSVLSEENFACLEAMGDDLASLLNVAVEQYLRGLRPNGHAEILEAKAQEYHGAAVALPKRGNRQAGAY